MLIIAGGCRNDKDIERLNYLKETAMVKYGLKNDVNIEWKINISFSTLKKLLQVSLQIKKNYFRKRK